jgi:DNA-binding SARP family transcriptional activator
MTPVFHIQLLGPVQLTRHDGRAVKLRRKSRLLLAYIAAQSHPITREHIITVFWPDEPLESARQLLRTSLYQIKAACGDVIVSQQQQIMLAGPEVVTVDIQRIRHSVPGSPELEALTSGPVRIFCQDIAGSDMPEFDMWLDSERLQWQHFCSDVLFHHAERQLDQQALTSAVASCLSAHKYAPLREDIVQLAMRLKYHTNDRAGAIALYVDLEKMLDEQLGVPPLPATRDVYDQLIMDTMEALVTPVARTVTTTVAPLVGRSAEMHALQQLKWQGHMVSIEGEGGIGKTHLAREFLRQSAAFIVHIGAFAGDQYLPYHGLITAFRHIFQQSEHRTIHVTPVLPPIWQSELRRLWPELPGTDPDSITPEAGETRLPEALALLLTHLSGNQRMAIFIDDVQWVDEATLRLVQTLVRRGLSFPWLCVLTLRTDFPVEYVQHILQQSEHAQQLTRISLAALDDEALHTLVAQINPSAPPHIIARAEGNPFMLIELLRHPQLSTLPSAISDLIQTRIQHLSPDAQRLLGAAAICGREFAIDEAAYLSQLADEALWIAIDEIRQHGLFHIVDGKHGRFDHSLTVETINHIRGAVRTAHLHRTLAHWLMRQSTPNHARIATHLQAADDTTDLVPHALAAARDAHHVGAWQTAEHFMHMAIRHSPVTEQASLWLECGEMLFMAGNEEAAITALQHAIDLDDSPSGYVSDAASIAMARTHIPSARFGEAIALCEPLCTHPNPALAMHAAFVCGSAHSLLGEHLVQAQHFLDVAEQHCRQLADYEVMPRILFEQAGILAQQGDIEAAVQRYQNALESAEQTTSTTGHIWRILAHNNMAYHLHLLDDTTQATRHIRIAFRLAERFGQRMILSYVHSTAGEIALAQGDITRAEQHFHDGLIIAEHYAMHERIAGLTANVGRVAIARHDHQRATALLSDAVQRADQLGIRHLATQIRIWLIPLLTIPAEAQRHFQIAQEAAQQGSRTHLQQQLAQLAHTMPA